MHLPPAATAVNAVGGAEAAAPYAGEACVACRLVLAVPDAAPAAQSHVLVGSLPELGAWDLAGGLPLQPCGDGLLTAELDLPPGSAFECKVGVCRRRRLASVAAAAAGKSQRAGASTRGTPGLCYSSSRSSTAA